MLSVTRILAGRFFAILFWSSQTFLTVTFTVFPFGPSGFGTGFSTVFSVYSASLPTFTVDVSPPLTTLPGPFLAFVAPSRTFTVRVTLPSLPAGTDFSVHVTTPSASTPLSLANTSSTFLSSLSLITISAASVL